MKEAIEGTVYKCKRCKKNFAVGWWTGPAVVKTNFYRFDLLTGRDWRGPGKVICPECAASFRNWMGGEEQVPFSALGDA